MHRGPLASLTPWLLAASACAVHAPSSAPVVGSSPSPSVPATSATSRAIATEPVPVLRLPSDVHPLRETVALTVDPARERYSGKVTISLRLDRPRREVWLHGKALHVTSASIDGVPGEWREVGDAGLASVTLPHEASGEVVLRVAFDAPFETAARGLFKVAEGGATYAFTQLEPIDARRAFPCFDEPGFKIPFSIELDVPSGMTAIANAAETAREARADGTTRVTFATTPPLPSYLVAFAVGPLDVVAAPPAPPNEVRARPLPLRAIVPKGRAAEASYALAHAPEILALLERYFGREYPWDKLDLLAVPGFGGAMENAGAITFAEYFLLMDGAAPIEQRRGYAETLTHELSHMWFGDLVTMAWWDDTWLNEAFATWMEAKGTDAWDPRSRASLDLMAAVQHAMRMDELSSARRIRQGIQDESDIDDAFDDITYQKGGGVLRMFERWLGPDVFQRGVRGYLRAHEYGSATADDFVQALGAAAGRDLRGPFASFLGQPGVPFVEVEVQCAPGAPPRAHLSQSRFLPRGSGGDTGKTWELPVCARFEADGAIKESCTLLGEREGDLALDATSCPAWVFPNAGGAGYYRFSLASRDLAALRDAGVARLSTEEKIAFANALRAGLARGTTSWGDTLRAASRLAEDAEAEVAGEPADLLATADDWLASDPARGKLEAYVRTLYRPAYQRLGWSPARGEEAARIELRRRVIGVLAFTGRDPEVRAEAKRRAAQHLGIVGAAKAGALSEELAPIALAVLGEDADAKTFDAMLAALSATHDEARRAPLVSAIAGARDPSIAARARELALDPRLRPAEALLVVGAQLAHAETRDAEWQWIKAHWDALVASTRTDAFAAPQLVSSLDVFCDDAHAAEVSAFLKERARGMEGAPRALAMALESIHLCAVRRAAQEPQAREFFSGR